MESTAEAHTEATTNEIETSPQELSPSELGTKDYWTSSYKKELDNFLSHGDEGEVWFGQQNESRIIRYIVANFSKTAAIVDIGCGNGHLLIQLAEKHDFKNLKGIDYVEEALELARTIVRESNLVNIQFERVDLLTKECGGNYDVVVDKGTYDAICLMPDMSHEHRRSYIDSIKRLLNKEASQTARFVLTSCNWSKEELLAHFGDDFDLLEELPAPTFCFGGKQGRTVTSLIFRVKQS